MKEIKEEIKRKEEEYKMTEIAVQEIETLLSQTDKEHGFLQLLKESKVWKKGGFTQQMTGTPFTWNPQKKGSNLTLSNNNLTLTKTAQTSDWNHGLVFGTVEFKGGDQYWQLMIGARCSTQMLGVAKPNAFSETSIYNYGNGVFLYCHGGGYGTLGTKVGTCMGFTVNDIIGIHLAWNATNSTYDLNYYKNGTFQATVFRGIPVPVVAAVEVGDPGDSLTLDSTAKKPN